MSQFFRIHPDNPQQRLLKQAVEIVHGGGVIVYPTDSCYAIGCHLGDKDAMERIRRIRQVDKHHNFTLVCRDLGEIATYAKVDNAAYRLLRALTPGAYTFILRATNEVPRRLMHPRRRTIGLRVPEHTVVLGLLEQLGEPMMSVTLSLPGDELPMTDAEEIEERLGKQVDLIIDGGHCGHEPTTVVNLSTGGMEITRHGRGDTGLLKD